MWTPFVPRNNKPREALADSAGNFNKLSKMPPKKKGGKKGKKKKGGDDDEGGPQPEGEPTEKEVLLKQEWVSITEHERIQILYCFEHKYTVYPCFYSFGHCRRWRSRRCK